MNSKNHTYYFHGQAFDKIGLIAFSFEKLSLLSTPPWERDIWTFITEWFSATDSLEVKTSGSTGKPKAIRIAKRNMAASARATIEFLDLKPRDVSLLCLPVKYIAGKMMVVRSLVGGLDMYFAEPSSSPSFDHVKQIDFCAMVPMQVKALLDLYGTTRLDRIRNLIIGGGFLPDGMDEQLKEISNSSWQTYGMTETITHIAMRRLNGPDASDYYQPLPGVKISRNESECLVVSAKHIGISCLTTNDFCEVGTDMRFRLLGRFDNVINSGGIKLYPEQLEEKLAGFSKKEYFVAGLPDDRLGQRLVLFIENENRVDQKVYYLWKEVEKKLSGYDIPREIIFIPEFARTENGKINRTETVGLI